MAVTEQLTEAVIEFLVSNNRSSLGQVNSIVANLVCLSGTPPLKN